jgi:hypothetical protein
MPEIRVPLCAYLAPRHSRTGGDPGRRVALERAWHTVARGFRRDRDGARGATPDSMSRISLRFVRSFLVATVSLVLVAACGSAASSPPPECVDFTVTTADLACSADDDCTFVSDLHLCPGDPSCGFENPVNVGAAARYTKATAGVPVSEASCGAPAPVRCVNQRCAVVSF